MTGQLEHYFLRLVAKQKSEPVSRILELSLILLDLAADPAVRRHFRLFLSELGRQHRALTNGHGG